MSSSDDRERSLERLLKAAVASPLGEGTADCLDAERLAAWSDGGLDEASARQVEAHLSTCAHCQAMAAAFARTEPVVVAAPARTAWGARWVTPAGVVAAAAMAVWFVAPWRASTPVPELSMARNEAPAAELPAPASLNQAPEPDSSMEDRLAQQAMPLPSRPASAAAAAAAKTGASADAVSGAVPRPAPAAPAAVAVAAPPPAAVMAPPPAATPPPPAAPAPARESVTSETLTVRAEAPLIQAQSGERSVVVAAGNLATLTDLGSLPMAEFAAPSSAPAGGDVRIGGAGRGGVARVAPPIRWRILGDGRVERSANAGASWEPVQLPSAGRVTAGGAPAPLVCWLIGEQGTVLLSTDGRTFVRVPFPDTADLRQVSATDARAATVTTRDDRVFSTSDAGASWRAIVR